MRPLCSLPWPWAMRPLCSLLWALGCEVPHPVGLERLNL